MRKPWLLVLLVLAAALGGYAVAGPQPVNAQAEPFPFAVGDTVRFTKPDYGTRVCQIAEVRGAYIRCGKPREERPRESDWLNASVMIELEIRGTQ
jgi:hypothetical protein